MTSMLEKNTGLDKVSATDVRRRYAEFSDIVHASDRPVEITLNGKADLIVMKPSFYIALLEVLEDYDDQLRVFKLLIEEQDPQTVPFEDVFKDEDRGEFAKMSIDDLLNQ
jgi:PHD/YefM family antitoxin component YafN of YafNO toxin-antitoxin module